MLKSVVVDASTTLKWIDDEIESDKALKHLKKYLSRKTELIAPNIWLFEIANNLKTA